MKRVHLLLILLATIFILAACSQSAAAPTATFVLATATPTVSPAAPVAVATATTVSPGDAGNSANRLPELPPARPEVTAVAVPTPDDQAPRVEHVLPAYSWVVADLRPEYKIIFSRPMDKVLTAAALIMDPLYEHSISWPDDTTMVIVPLENLLPGTRYKISFSELAQSPSGVPLAGNTPRYFNVASVLATTTVPASSGSGEPLLFTFNYPMDSRQLIESFSLEPQIDGTVSWLPETQTLAFVPDEPWQPYTEYEARFSGPLYGAPVPGAEPALLQLDDTVRSFLTPSPLVSYEPTRGLADPRQPIRITFDRPVDRRTVEDAFSMRPTVPGAFVWDEYTMTFVPDGGSLPEEDYFLVTLDTTARDATGAALLQETLYFYFETGLYASTADFGGGSVPVQVVTASGRRAIHYRNLTGAVQDVRFALYHVPPEAFMARYLGGQRDVAGLSLWGTWLSTTNGQGDNWHSPQEVILPENIPAGVYLLTIESDFVEAGIFVLLTDQVLTLKRVDDELLVWDYDIGGAAAGGADVAIYDSAGALLATATTDGDGLAALPEDLPEAHFVVARRGDELVMAGLTGAWWRSGYNRTSPPYQIHVATDRPIYRPGQRVYFRAIVRHDDDAVLTQVAAGTPIRATISDPRNNRVQTFDLIAGDFGTVDGAFDIGPGAMLGDYQVTISIAGSSTSQQFKVQDYRKPDYNVSVTSESERIVRGESVTVQVEAEYFYGEPVAGARVTIRKFDADYGDWYRRDSDVTVTTDAQGKATYTFTPSYAGLWAVEATVDDGSHQNPSGLAYILVFPSDQQLSIERSGYLKSPGEPFAVNVQVVDIFDDPLSNRPVTVELRRYSRASRDYDIIIDSTTVSSDATGRARASLMAPDAGFYRLIARTTDSSGRRIEKESWIFAWNSRYSQWYGESGALSVYSEQESYLPGETARIFIAGDVTGEALLTLERGAIHGELRVQLTPPMTIVELPIDVSYAPNIFVGVQAWLPQDNSLTEDMYYSVPDYRLAVATTEIQVAALDKILQVEVIPERDTYAPGATAEVTLRVTNYAGVPVSAEVALAVVDEAIFALSPDLTVPLYDAFYFPRQNRVRTYDSMRPVRRLWSRNGGEGGGGGGGPGSPVVPRQEFADTAAWYPALRTDANGEVRVSVPLPDNLTTWRFTAHATTADTQVGSAIGRVLVRQDVVVRPLLPRTLTAGDSWQLSAMIHNYSDTAQTMQVALTPPAGADLLAVTAPLTQTITVAPNGAVIVGWPVEAPLAGSGFVTIAAVPAGGQPGDAVRLPIMVQPLAIPDVSTLVGQFEGQLDATVLVPEDALDMSVIEINLSRSIGGTLIEGTEYLTGYPYGCVEQTMSRALPNAVVGRALFQLGIGDPARFNELEPMILASIQRLYGFQHGDGGWGWWYSDPSHDYQTAWVVFGLAVTAEAGYEVEPAVLERGAAWLGGHLDSMDVRTRAFALYSMARAGHGDLDQTEALLSQIDELDTFSQAALALALHIQGESAAAGSLVDVLLATVTNDGDEAYWSGAYSDGAYRRKTMASDVRNTALALSALTQIRPGTAVEDNIVTWLMAQRRSAGWGTTNETSFALLALTDHLLAQPGISTPTAYTIWLNDTAVASGTLGPGQPTVKIVLPAGAELAGSNNLRITQSGGGQLYYTINRRAFVPEAEIAPSGAIEISRAYYDPDTNRVITEFVPGQLVKVRLTVNLPEAASYVIVEDQLPGGFEALNEALANAGGGAYESSGDYTYKEVWGDRVSFFITEMDAGMNTLTYFVRVTQAGSFTAMPVEAYAMYDLTLWGRSASAAIVIAAAPVDGSALGDE